MLQFGRLKDLHDFWTPRFQSPGLEKVELSDNQLNRSRVKNITVAQESRGSGVDYHQLR